MSDARDAVAAVWRIESARIVATLARSTNDFALAEDVALDPVVRGALAVLVEEAGLLDGLAVVEGALEDDLAEPLDEGAVGVALTVGEGVVLPVAGHPLLGDDGGRQPEPGAHGKLGEVVEPHALVRLLPVQEERDADVRQVACDDDEQYGLPPVGAPASEIRHRTSYSR